jgi:hypothetical protein
MENKLYMNLKRCSLYLKDYYFKASLLVLMTYMLIRSRLRLLEIGQFLKQLVRCVVSIDWPPSFDN